MKKIFCVFLLCIPFVIDIFGYRQFLFGVGFCEISPESFAENATIAPPNFLGIFEAVELCILFCYITIIRRNIIRLILIISTVVFCTLGMILSSVADILARSTIYSVAVVDLISIQNICAMAACFYLFSLAFMCMSNILFRRLSFLKMLSLTLIVSGAVGVILTRFHVIADPRCLQIAAINDTLRFSVSELFYLFGLELAFVTYIGEFLEKYSAKIAMQKIQVLDRQYRIADYYYQRVHMGEIECVSPMWESMLIGSGLDITRVGRQYYGVPDPDVIQQQIHYVEASHKLVHFVPHIIAMLVLVVIVL
ncbi:hypothetical protein [Candidatus Uabimicrobium amorphum]|uniref:Uncharacterized protein n=1 Tax=Uabimicrobium amorphum TaxID=2596890 RepID=A0A5S9IJG1_UABAM|nr:hypothetical protein [Candidatus Uabimicrobium amorphum]BBM82641.1 hypothetical protein UABAM_00984 [Candidatus Uabimicrobium amorphum]